MWRLADGSLGTDLRAGDLDEGAFLAKHLDRLLEVLPPNAERRVRLLASTRAGDSRLVSEICAWVERRTDDGAFEEAVSLFEDALSLARAHDHRDAELRVLACVVQEAASRPTPARLNIAARLIGEAERDDAAPLSALVAAATLWSSGEFGRALAELRDVGPSSMERLELTRMAIGANLRAAVSTEDAVAWLESWRAWAAATPSRGAHWWAALGRVRYLRQDLDGAAEAHALAAAQEPSPAGALRFAISRVQCLVDGGRHEEALTVGQELLRTSVQLREPYSEARLWVILRAATYRSGAEMEPDDELVPLLRAVAPPLVLQAAVTEAAVAWRGGDVARCAVVAARGLVGFPSDTPAALLLRALALQHSGDVQEGVAVLNALGPATPPGVALQVRSLVSRVSASAQDTDVLKGLATMFPGSSWHLRREVLSVEECVRGMSPDFVPG